MVNVRKRENVYRYQFDGAHIDGKRKNLQSQDLKQKVRLCKLEQWHIMSICKQGIVLFLAICYTLII